MPSRSRKYTDARLAVAVAQSSTIREVLTAIGLVPRGGNYHTIRRRILELGLDATHLRTFRRGNGIGGCSDEAIIEAGRTSRSLAQVLSKLRVRPGGNQMRLKARIERLGLDTSHFRGQGWRRGTRRPVVPARPLAELLVVGKLTNTRHLRRRLIEAGRKPGRCERCRRVSWNGRPIPLELDHINGRRDDNRLSNLRVLCPNCHAQTDNYRGRNIRVSSEYC